MVQGWGSFYGLQFDEPDDRQEYVYVVAETGRHDTEGRPIKIRYRLPRVCPFCKRDTMLTNKFDSTWELPVVVPRREAEIFPGIRGVGLATAAAARRLAGGARSNRGLPALKRPVSRRLY